MRPRPRSPVVIAAASLLATAAPAVARAYSEPIHQLIGERALPDGMGTALPLPSMADVDALRRATWRAGAEHPDPSVRERFLRRWPRGESFDAWAWKELLGLTPEARVVGIDVLPPSEGDGRRIAARASRDPDEDGRNVARFAHDGRRQVRRDADGQPLPADPKQLEMGALTGISSQAHAHYGLARVEKSDAPEVLKSEPWRFAVPPDAQGFAPEFAQVHTDLALAAAALGTPGADALGLTYLGAAAHYLEDVANQIHTLQAVYPFFVDAKIQAMKGDLLSLWGLLRPRPGFVEIGLGIIKNHHLFLEDLWAKRVAEALAGRPASPAVEAGIARLAAGDPVLERALDARRLSADGPFAAAIAEELVAASCREGADVYLAAREVALSRLSRAGYEFEGDPDAEVDPGASPERLDRFYDLEGRGLGRAATAIRRHERLYREALASAGGGDGRRRVMDGALGRLVASGVDGLDARERRLEAWIGRAGPARPGNGAPGAVAALLAAVAAAVALAVRRRGG